MLIIHYIMDFHYLINFYRKILIETKVKVIFVHTFHNVEHSVNLGSHAECLVSMSFHCRFILNQI